MTSRATKFRELLNSGKLEFLCEAHNGISAKIVEEAGFKVLGLVESPILGAKGRNIEYLGYLAVDK